MQRKPCKGGGRAWREQPQAKGCCSCQRPEGPKTGGPGGVWPGWHLWSEFWPPEQRIYFCCLKPVSASQQPQEMNTRTKHSEGAAPPTKHLLPRVSYCHMPRSTQSPSLPHAVNRANHLELGNRWGASDPSFASKPLVHPPARQEVQSRAGAMLDHWWARTTHHVCATGAWLSSSWRAGGWGGWGAPTWELQDNPFESQAPAEVQMATALCGYENPHWSQAQVPISGPLSSCKTSHRSLDLSGLTWEYK